MSKTNDIIDDLDDEDDFTIGESLSLDDIDAFDGPDPDEAENAALFDDDEDDEVLPVDVMNAIQLDSLLKVPVEKSKLTYTAGMLSYRKDFEKWAAGLPEGAVVEIPAE